MPFDENKQVGIVGALCAALEIIMEKIELNLFENAINSLNEALLKYEEGRSGNSIAFKFSILNFSHFFELALKYYVSQSHELLIYKNPFSKKIGKENTISAWDAVHFLKNDGCKIENEFIEDLEWLKSIRNNIEHHKFSLEIDKVEGVLGRLMKAFNEFNSLVVNFDLKAHIDSNLVDVFDSLAETYKEKLCKAIELAEEVGGIESGCSCSSCGHVGTMSLKGEVCKCHFCGEESPQIECCVCGESLPEHEGRIFNDCHPSHVDYICEGCLERIENM